jgi:hypothetical protein
MSDIIQFHNKTHDLSHLPLWECPNCGRFEFSPIGRVAQSCVDCAAMMERIIEPGGIVRFEAVAQQFHRDTGYLRPGKSAAPGDYRNSNYDEREAAWQKWNNEPVDTAKLCRSRNPPPGIIA